MLVFLCSDTTFFKILAKPLDSIFLCFSLMAEADIWNWLGTGSLGCPLSEFSCRGMAEERFGIHIFLCRSDFFADRMFFWMLEGVIRTMGGNLNARGELQAVTCPLF